MTATSEQTSVESAALDEDIEAALDAVDRPEDVEPDPDGNEPQPPWKIDGPGSADWAMRKYAKAQATIADVRVLAKRQVDAILAAAHVHIEPIEAWAEEQIDKAQRELDHWEWILTDYHRELREADDKITSFTLPHGVLRSRKTADTVSIELDLFVPWAEKNRPDLVVTKAVPADKATIKKALEGTGEPGQSDFGGPAGEVGEAVMDPDSGEIVPGVSFHTGRVNYSVEVAQ